MDVIFRKGLPKTDKVEDHVRYLETTCPDRHCSPKYLSYASERERETEGERHPASKPQGLIKRCDEAALLYCSMWGLSFCFS